MEQRLRQMFEYQRFENDPRLKKMLDDALSRYDFSGSEGKLSDDDAGLLNAAGSTTANPHSKEKLS